MVTHEQRLNELETLVPPPEKPNWPQTLWRASGLHKCYRLQILEAVGVKLPIDDELRRKFDLRKAVHERVQDWIRGKWTPVAIEKHFVDNELRLSGHVDAIIYEEPITLIEIKGLQPGYIKALKSGRAKPYWGYQVGFYADALLHELRESREKPGKILLVSYLIDVETGRPHTMNVEPQDYKSRVTELNTYWDSGLLPEQADSTECAKCPLSHICTEPITLIDDWSAAVIDFLGKTYSHIEVRNDGQEQANDDSGN